VSAEQVAMVFANQDRIRIQVFPRQHRRSVYVPLHLSEVGQMLKIAYR
jgi:hypothetical protein